MMPLEEAIKAILQNKKLREEYLLHLERISTGGRIGDGANSMTVASIRDLLENSPPNSATNVMHKITEAAQESARTFGMPVMSIKDNLPNLAPNPPTEISEHWSGILKDCPKLKRTIKAVGRLSLIRRRETPKNVPIGTAWFIRSNILVTNRHVAEFFANTHAPYEFLPDNGIGKVSALVDLKKEEFSSASRELTIEDVIYMDGSGGDVDLAFLKVESPRPRIEPIPLDLEDIVVGANAAVVGYPMKDPGVNRELSDKFFGTYGFKKISCGTILSLEGNRIAHSCPTLHGNSGSPLISLVTGNVIGIHFGGNESDDNYALSAAKLQTVLTLNNL
jgi:V8-like Glu-specific endopeptidase